MFAVKRDILYVLVSTASEDGIMPHPDTLHVPAMEPGSDATQGHDAKGPMTIITIEDAGKARRTGSHDSRLAL